MKPELSTGLRTFGLDTADSLEEVLEDLEAEATEDEVEAAAKKTKFTHTQKVARN